MCVDTIQSSEGGKDMIYNLFEEIEHQGYYSIRQRVCHEIYDLVFDSIALRVGINLTSRNTMARKELLSFILNMGDDEFSVLTVKKHRTVQKEIALEIECILRKYYRQYIDKPFCFSDDHSQGYPCFSWRIVRPFKNDIGHVHYDDWFRQKGITTDVPPYSMYKTLKIWIPIESTPERTNLVVFPFSHKDVHSNSSDISDISIEMSKNYDRKMVKNKPLEPLVFDMNLLHVGSYNDTDMCRVSIEHELHVSV